MIYIIHEVYLISVKSRGVTWAVHAARMGDMGLGRRWVDGSSRNTGSAGSVWDVMVSFCEHGDGLRFRKNWGTS